MTALALTAPAFARVGVTSATDGDPLGKPPAEAERVLRIGIDVQASEVIRTGANDRAHLVFLDGTALTVGPNATLTIDKFVYDPSTKTGEIAINATKGVLRLVGGKISKTNPITVTTPSSTIGIRGGICVLDVQPNTTSSTFLFGNNMSVTGRNGQTQNVTRPGSQVMTANGGAPSAPTLVNQGALSGQFGQLEGATGGGGGQAGQQGGQQQGGSQGGPGGNTAANGGNAERGAQNFAQNNGPNAGGPGQAPPAPVVSPQNNLNNNPLINNPNANPNQTPTRSTSTTTTRVVVSRNTLGRYLAGPEYTSLVSPGTDNLGVTPAAGATNANNALASSSGTVTTTTTTTTTTVGISSSSTATVSNTITLSVPGTGTGTGSVTLPWQANTLTNGFDVPNMTALGGQVLTNGKGYVSPNGEFFAYVFSAGSTKVGIFGGTPTSTSDFPTTGIAAYTLVSVGDTQKLPFASDTIRNNSALTDAASISKLYAAYSSQLGQTVNNQPTDARATALQAAISISGVGAAQQSYAGVFIGQFFRDLTTGTNSHDAGVALSGNYNATYRTNATGATIGRIISAESTPTVGASNNAIYGTAGNDGVASAMVLTPDKLVQTYTANGTGGAVDSVTTTRTAQASYDYNQVVTTGNANVGYFPVTAATQTTTGGVGDAANRTTTTAAALNGYVGGVVDRIDSNNSVTDRRIVQTTSATALSLNTNATNNRASVDVTVAGFDGSGRNATFHLGGTTGGDASTSAYIDKNTYAVLDRPSTLTGTTEIAGSTTNQTSSTFMVSYGVAATPSLFTNASTSANPVAACTTCDFMTWGWWSGDITYTAGTNNGSKDRLNLATYVAGTLSSVAEVTNTANATNNGTTATYKGAMVGNVYNGTSSYVQAGSYQNIWNFGQQKGSVLVSFDGSQFGSATALNTQLTNSTTNQFTTPTSLTATNGTGNVLNLTGSFFSSSTTTSNVAGQAGSFNVTNNGSGTAASTYKAGGTFTAGKVP